MPVLERLFAAPKPVYDTVLENIATRYRHRLPSLAQLPVARRCSWMHGYRLKPPLSRSLAEAEKALYHGYGGCWPEPSELLSWTSQGYVMLAIDVRGKAGESSDTLDYPGGQRARAPDPRHR